MSGWANVSHPESPRFALSTCVVLTAEEAADVRRWLAPNDPGEWQQREYITALLTPQEKP